MKKLTWFALLLISVTVSAQTKEKIKGSKIVTVEQKEIDEFAELEVSDNLEIFLIKGDKCGVEIEADDNLHEAIQINQHASLLQLSASKDVTGAKKFSVRITYTDSFKMLTAKNQANVTALADIKLDNFTFKAFDGSKIFANVKSKNFTFMGNDKSKAELNITGEQTNIELSKNAQLKALISSSFLKFDMYQKSTAVVEGDANDLKLRLDNNANFIGKNFTAKNANLIAEGYTVCSVLCTTWMAIEATGKAEISIYGDQKIDLRKFQDNATLYKKPTK
ncbi:GIN domain-containing protein [Flavobacterium sp.]|uniref:GIN domain-containing protein n=1 Tax=Flavobacterium sp. TaxID=239 RepID=UPI0039E3D5CD